MFKTDSRTKSPTLVPVLSSGHALPKDQKKFSISRGGYGNIRDNKESKEGPNLEAEASHISQEEIEDIVPLNSVRSIGRGGFGNQIKHIRSHESKEKDKSKTDDGFMKKVKNIFK